MRVFHESCKAFAWCICVYTCYFMATYIKTCYWKVTVLARPSSFWTETVTEILLSFTVPPFSYNKNLHGNTRLWERHSIPKTGSFLQSVGKCKKKKKKDRTKTTTAKKNKRKTKKKKKEEKKEEREKRNLLPKDRRCRKLRRLKDWVDRCMQDK